MAKRSGKAGLKERKKSYIEIALGSTSRADTPAWERLQAGRRLVDQRCLVLLKTTLQRRLPVHLSRRRYEVEESLAELVHPRHAQPIRGGFIPLPRHKCILMRS